MKANRYLLNRCVVTIIIDAGNEQCFISELCYTRKMTFAHCWKVVRYLESEGILTTRKMGRKRLLKLTKKGWEIHEALRGVCSLLGKKNSISLPSELDSG